MAWLNFIDIIFRITIIISYSLGISLIVTLKRRKKAKIQHILLLNLSAYIIVVHSFVILYDILEESLKSHPRVWIKFRFVLVVIMYVLNTASVLAMVLINIDRLLEVVLNIKYPLYVTQTKVKNRYSSLISQLAGKFY